MRGFAEEAKDSLRSRKDSDLSDDSGPCQLPASFQSLFGPGEAVRLAGDNVDPSHFLHHALKPDLPLGGADSWGASSAASNPVANLFRPRTGRSDDSNVSLPEPGTVFLGFHLLTELGRGTFGRVYLAKQGDLANRLVALKVSKETFAESQKLAQLQHTNIVPLYSLHQAGTLQAACMPYFGSTTLADVLQDLGRRESLPESGKGLIHTLEDRKSRTRACLDRSDSPSRNLQPSATPPSEIVAAPAHETPSGQHPAEEVASSLRHLEGLSYVEAILWIGSALADGLAHAHERGIFHRDLKPANILLTDHGQPMLLDFNLADDIKQQRSRGGQVGGTLPYMSPEHLAAFSSKPDPLRPDRPPVVDGRSDIYSLGVILHELLTGRPPFVRHGGAMELFIPQMIADRLQGPPSLQSHNPSVTPAIESILERCLAPDPEQRYHNAHELREDLDRHLAHQPLQHAPERSLAERFHKWCRRHPRLSSTTTSLVLTGILILTLGAALFVRNQRLAQLEAVDQHRAFQTDLASARLMLAPTLNEETTVREGREIARRALNRYRVLDATASGGPTSWKNRAAIRQLPPDQQQQIPAAVAELLLLLGAWSEDPEEAMGFNIKAEECFSQEPKPPSLWFQRGVIQQRLGKTDEAKNLLVRAEQLAPINDEDRYLLAVGYCRQGRYRKAISLLEKIVAKNPDHFAALYLLGNCCLDGFGDSPGSWRDAVNHYTACLSLRPRYHAAWYGRGLAHLRLQQFDRAEKDFSRAVELRETYAPAYIARALAHEQQKRYKVALQDLDLARDWGGSLPRILLVRARLKEILGDSAGAKLDRGELLKLTPRDEDGWISRGMARLPADIKGALADFQHASRLNPESLVGWQNQANLLAEHLDRTSEAVAAMEKIVKLYPDRIGTRSSRGILLARLGRRKEALADAEAELKRAGEHPEIQYQTAGIYAQLSKTVGADRDRAFALLARSLQAGYGHDLLAIDSDLDPIRNDSRFVALQKAVQTLTTTAQSPSAGNRYKE